MSEPLVTHQDASAPRYFCSFLTDFLLCSLHDFCSLLSLLLGLIVHDCARFGSYDGFDTHDVDGNGVISHSGIPVMVPGSGNWVKCDEDDEDVFAPPTESVGGP